MALKHSHAHANTRWFFLLVATVVVYLFWNIIEPLALTLVTAGVAAIVLSPLERRLHRRVKNRKLSVLLVVLGTLFLIVVPLFLMSLLIVKQSLDIFALAADFQVFLSTFDINSHPLFQSLPVVAQEYLLSIDLGAFLSETAQWILERVGGILGDFARLLFSTVIFFVSLYYILHDRDKIKEQAFELSPLKDKLDDKIIHRIVSTVRNVVFGALIVALVQGIMATIGMAIFGVPGSIIWGALVIIAAQVPLLGAAIVMIPAIAFLFLSGDSAAAIGLTIWSVTVVGLIDNVLSPILIEGRTKMHALLILISILGALQLYGPIGLIIGPTVLAALLIVVDLYKSGILEHKH